jgi:hypothetical protein
MLFYILRSGADARETTVYGERKKRPLTLAPTHILRTEQQKLLELRTISHQIKVEELRKRNRVSHCHRCQIFGHSASFCAAVRQCVNYGEGHSTAHYSKTRDSPTR